MQNYSMFKKLDIPLDNRKNKLPLQNENGIFKHFSTLESKFERYFLEITNDEFDFVRNPFTFFVEKLSDECQDKFSELINDFSARQGYHEKLLTQFWIEIKNSYSKTTEKALRILIPYMFTWLCEAGFSTLLKSRPNKKIDLMLKTIYVVLCPQTVPRI